MHPLDGSSNNQYCPIFNLLSKILYLEWFSIMNCLLYHFDVCWMLIHQEVVYSSSGLVISKTHLLSWYPFPVIKSDKTSIRISSYCKCSSFFIRKIFFLFIIHLVQFCISNFLAIDLLFWIFDTLSKITKFLFSIYIFIIFLMIMELSQNH